MNKEREPKPYHLTIEGIAQTAKEITLVNGVHSPTVIVEGSQCSIAAEFHELLDTFEGKLNQLFLTGVNFARNGEVGRLRQVFFISEAWMSLIQEDEVPATPPSEDPDRKEVLIISGKDISLQETHMIICEMIRDDQGVLTDIRDLEGEDTEQALEFPLLNAFIDGFSVATYDPPTP